MKWLATISTGVYAGGNLYVSIIEASYRNKQSPKLSAQILEITHSATHRAWTSIALFGATCAVGGFLLTQHRYSAAEWLWADTFLLATIPLRKYLIDPTSAAIMDSKDTVDVSTEKGESWLVSKLHLWNSYHDIRTVFSIATFGYMACLLAHKK